MAIPAALLVLLGVSQRNVHDHDEVLADPDLDTGTSIDLPLPVRQALALERAGAEAAPQGRVAAADRLERGGCEVVPARGCRAMAGAEHLLPVVVHLGVPGDDAVRRLRRRARDRNARRHGKRLLRPSDFDRRLSSVGTIATAIPQVPRGEAGSLPAVEGVLKEVEPARGHGG